MRKLYHYPYKKLTVMPETHRILLKLCREEGRDANAMIKVALEAYKAWTKQTDEVIQSMALSPKAK